MWLTILIIGTIIGGVIGYFYCTENYENGFVGMVLCAAFFFAICFCLKMSFDDKIFICTDVNIGDVKASNFGSFQKKLERSKPSILGSKMVLEFFDNSVKCTSTYLRNNQELTEVHVLDEVMRGIFEVRIILTINVQKPLILSNQNLQEWNLTSLCGLFHHLQFL